MNSIHNSAERESPRVIKRRPERCTPLSERFWRYVTISEESDCWWWSGNRNRRGYGKIQSEPPEARTLVASRASWELHYGAIPDGMLVCHRCDNPSCVRPGHLFLGTSKDNIRDSVQKGRHACLAHVPPRRAGTESAAAKLTDDNVRVIRALFSGGHARNTQLARMFSVTSRTIKLIVDGSTWKHITGAPPQEQLVAAIRHIPPLPPRRNGWATKPEAMAHGERHNGAIMTETTVRTMRALAVSGVPRKALALQFGISISGVHQIIRRESWRHVA